MSRLSHPATSPVSPENQVEMAALNRHLRRATGFSVAFVVVNHPSSRDEVVREVAATSSGVVVRLRRGAGGPVPQIESALGDARPPAVLLVDLESLVDEGPSPALDNLNLNRDFFARRLACPLVVFGPAWLAAALARDATDLWSVRSNVFELVGDTEAGLASVEHAGRSLDWEIAPEERRAKARLLEDLATEAIESGRGGRRLPGCADEGERRRRRHAGPLRRGRRALPRGP